MCLVRSHSLIIALVANNDIGSHRHLQSYPENVICLLNNYATSHAIAEIDTAILRKMQLDDMTLHLYANELFNKSDKATNVYDEAPLKIVFIKKVDLSFHQNVPQCKAENPQAAFPAIALQTDAMLSISI